MHRQPERLRPGAVYLFPGQGSQVDDMRARVERWCPALLELAETLTGGDPFAAPERTTRFLQPAVYCASIAGWKRARTLDDAEPAAFAGHSLGELAALAAGGALTFEDGLRLVVRRAELMERAAAESVDDGGMLALLRADDEVAERVAAEHGLTVANDNAPGEIVLSGAGAELDAVRERAGALDVRAVRLPIKGAFHSPAMAGIAAELEQAVREVEVRAPAAPIFSSITTRPFEDVARELGQALMLGVRWRATLLRLAAAGAGRFVEVGPGKVLTGLVRRTLPDADAVALELVSDESPEPARA